MNKKKLNKILALFGLLLLFLMTYFRENFLLEINALIGGEEYNRAYKYWLYEFFKNQPFENLTKWKWAITLVFSFTMSSLTIFSLYFWFGSKQILKTVSYIYVFVFAFAIILAIAGFLTGSFHEIYFILRKLLGLAQSPLPFFTFFALFYWDRREN